MSITGESFDYGPFAFIQTFDLQFAAAYFDYYGRYSYGNQPGICHWNLEMLQKPLGVAIAPSDLAVGLATFEPTYRRIYQQRMLQKLGFAEVASAQANALLMDTLRLLQETQVGYHSFFAELRQSFSDLWYTDADHILSESSLFKAVEGQALLQTWRQAYHALLTQAPHATPAEVLARLCRHNPLTVIVRPEIEAVWEKIDQADDWEPFYTLLKRLQSLI